MDEPEDQYSTLATAEMLGRGRDRHLRIYKLEALVHFSERVAQRPGFLLAVIVRRVERGGVMRAGRLECVEYLLDAQL